MVSFESVTKARAEDSIQKEYFLVIFALVPGCLAEPFWRRRSIKKMEHPRFCDGMCTALHIQLATDI